MTTESSACSPLTAMTGQISRAEKPVLLAVRAADPRAGAEMTVYLRARPGIVALPADYAHRADVVLVLDGPLGDGTLAWMRRVAGQTPHASRFVVVSDGIQGPQWQQAAACGLVSILSRQDSSNDRIVQAVLRLQQGLVELPGDAARPLPAAVRLDHREREVLRLVAEGHDTAKIARTLSYSERTVKNIIQKLLIRWNLRNRPHAVAFALRNGLL